MKDLHAYVRLTLLLAWALSCSGLNSLLCLVFKYHRPVITERLSRACFNGMLLILGIQVTVRGVLSPHRPLLLACNHISYLDIPVLGAHLNVRFTPKSEIAGWPLIGHFCRQIGCVFVDRRAQKTSDNQQKLREALQGSAALCLFPEGTTSDGKRLLPFRSSYFSLAESGNGVRVQPAAIRYTHARGLPVDAGMMPKIAWYGDMDLLPHIKELIHIAPIRAELILGEVIAENAIDRKDLCQKAHAEVERLRYGNSP